LRGKVVCEDCDVDGGGGESGERPVGRKKRGRGGSSSSSQWVTQDLTMLDDSDDNDDVNESTSTSISTRSNNTPQNNHQLEHQIQRITRLAASNPSSSSSDLIPAASFAADAPGNSSCLRPSSSLSPTPLPPSLGGGQLHCDPATAAAIADGSWDDGQRVAVVRTALGEAVKLVGRSIPSLELLLGRVHEGYDGGNEEYEAFCDGRRIVMNLFAFVGRVGPVVGDRGGRTVAAAGGGGGGGSASAPEALYPRSLVHDLVVVVTHELAHFLEPGAGHGPVWRDTHMRMVIEVMGRLEG